MIFFKLANSAPYLFADEASGYLRLDKQGSEYFNQLDSTDKSLFLDTMKKELADSIPLNIYEISIDKTQFDHKDPDGKNVLILVKIRPPKGDNQIRNVDQTFKDLHAMVRGKEISPLMYDNKNTTKYLDNESGFKRISRLYFFILLISLRQKKKYFTNN